MAEQSHTEFTAMSEGGMVADIIGAVASIDPVMGGVDR
jgi:NADH-quinone oxidoreductase subunit D